MTLEQAQSLIVGKQIEHDGKYFSFEKGNRLTITGLADPVYGEYKILVRGNCCFLKTEPPIINALDELPINILLGNIQSGIILTEI